GITLNPGSLSHPWRLAGCIDFIFPSGTIIRPGEHLLVVPFDPDNADALRKFRELYNFTDPDVQILGPYSGNLSDSGARIVVEKLLDVNPVNGSPAWAIVDEVIYFDQDPWTTEPNGTGKSLQRLTTLLSGNDPYNWKADTPRPGKGMNETSIESWMIY